MKFTIFLNCCLPFLGHISGSALPCSQQKNIYKNNLCVPFRNHATNSKYCWLQPVLHGILLSLDCIYENRQQAMFSVAWWWWQQEPGWWWGRIRANWKVRPQPSWQCHEVWILGQQVFEHFFSQCFFPCTMACIEP